LPAPPWPPARRVRPPQPEPARAPAPAPTPCPSPNKTDRQMRKLPDFVPTLFAALMGFLLDVEDDPLWHQADSDAHEEARTSAFLCVEGLVGASKG
jgi:hypothetical protein